MAGRGVRVAAAMHGCDVSGRRRGEATDGGCTLHVGALAGPVLLDRDQPPQWPASSLLARPHRYSTTVYRCHGRLSLLQLSTSSRISSSRRYGANAPSSFSGERRTGQCGVEVSPDGEPLSVIKNATFFQRPGWINNFVGLNGIVYHPNGYLLVIHTSGGDLFKVDPKTGSVHVVKV
ncbi:hypothetical protein E2562_027992 [Oryza meyeriana var. granulata]|uniref:Uncharacterized protein n=1 Tax=Oryza meyeriana var. granulata TaxID=110450 RepID=A0A6G1CTY6_9ORYZ|nr:hypothetical protein E2562_027992 [Oryza meyeriana var. granulata]